MITTLAAPRTDTPNGHLADSDSGGITLPPFDWNGKGSEVFHVGSWAVACGLWTTMIKEGMKGPRYKDWGADRRTRDDIKRFVNREFNSKTPGCGIGVCLGPGRGPHGEWLIDLEGDGPEAEDSRLKLFGGEIVESLGWHSRRGLHQLFAFRDGTNPTELLTNAGATVVEGTGKGAGVFKLDDFPGLEFRVGGFKSDGSVKQFQSVIPPMAGRRFNGCWTIAYWPDSGTATFEELARRRDSDEADRSRANGRPTRGSTTRPSPTNGNSTGVSAYVAKALKDECEAVERETEGNRNTRLNKAAFSLGTLIGAHVLARSDAERTLSEAARRARLDEMETRATIRSGLDAGIANPRDLSHVDLDDSDLRQSRKRGRKSKEETAAEKAAKAESAKTGASVDVGLYFERDRQLWIVGEEGAEPLANFTARITENVTRYEAGKELVRFRIQATHQDPAVGTRDITVPSDKFPAMAWIFALGAEFSPSAGRDRRDHLRCALQLLSTQQGIATSIEYTSLGWIRHGDAWLYLHAGGAIGVDGHSNAVCVDPPPVLARYRLPEPPTDSVSARAAIVATLAIWDLANTGTPGARGAAAISATLPFRAVLQPFNVSPHFGGPSGNLKTSTARLAIQHFSSDFRGRNAPSPAGWNDTSNAIQRLGYDAAFSVLLVDDLKTNAQLQIAEAIIQAQGNLQNRSRMAVDQSLQQSLDPRGTILSTGEIDPRTASTLGRMLVVEIKRGDIDRSILSRLQRSGDAGLFASAMAAYLRWLAPRLEEVREQHARLTNEIRDNLGEIAGAHPRHPDAVAQLIAAYQLYLGFAVEVGAIDRAAADVLQETAQDYLRELAAAQSDPQAEAKPGRRFLDLVASALRSKRCHLAAADSDNAPTTYPGACGWAKDWQYQGPEIRQTLEWEIPPNSKLIGFIDEDAGLIYLDDIEAVAIANDQSRRHHSPHSFSAIGRELLNEGLCRPHVEGGKTRASGHKRIHNHGKKRYFWVAIPNLFDPPEEPDDA